MARRRRTRRSLRPWGTTGSGTFSEFIQSIKLLYGISYMSSLVSVFIIYFIEGGGGLFLVVHVACCGRLASMPCSARVTIRTTYYGHSGRPSIRRRDAPGVVNSTSNVWSGVGLLKAMCSVAYRAGERVGQVSPGFDRDHLGRALCNRPEAIELRHVTDRPSRQGPPLLRSPLERPRQQRPACGP